MIRMFERHKIRSVVEMDGMWDFEPDAGSTGRLPRRYRTRLHVPGTWESHPDFRTWRGRGFFRRAVHCKRDGAIRLVFKGISHSGVVYWDGKKIGCHYNAFTPFAIEIPSVRAGAHTLVVEVDNTFGPHSALHKPNDYYCYGGLTRPVAVESIGDVFVERVWATPRRQGRGWSLDVRIDLKNIGKKMFPGSVELAVAGKTVTCPFRIGPRKTAELAETLRFTDVAAWSPDTPILHTLGVTLRDGEGQACDDLIERVGFREIKVKGRKILLNNREIKLRGFNRHEDAADFGCAVPVEVMTQDLDLMTDMNANFVRTSHYPNDERFLDMCDERGILVWEENHARALMADTMKLEVFPKQIANCDREMVLNHYNHPSIVMWGIFNECESFSALGRRHYEASVKRIRALDASRPLTSASCYPGRDRTLDLFDIVSFNRYVGWYGGERDRIRPELDKLLAWIRKDGNGNKPFIMSEFGAGAIPGWRAARRTKWTEEYQADLLAASLDVYLNHPRVNGVAVWQFCDVRVCEEWFHSRPRCMNNKGVVDEHRRPKLAYDIVKSAFGGDQ